MFPNATDADFAIKLREEMDELGDDPDPEEMADVAIVLMSWADRCGFDLEDAMIRKMQVNQIRGIEGRWRDNA